MIRRVACAALLSASLAAAACNLIRDDDALTINIAGERHAVQVDGIQPSGDVTEGNGEVVPLERTLEDFNSLELIGPFELVVNAESDAETRVVVTIDANLQSLLDTQVRGDNLVIRPIDSFRTGTMPRIEVTIAHPRAVRLRGSGDVTVNGLDVHEFMVSLVGSGDVHVYGSARELDLEIAGSGDIRVHGTNSEIVTIGHTGSGDMHIKGTTDRLAVELVGSGDIHAAALQAIDVEVDVVGSGSVNVAAAGTLDVEIVGSGDVTYTGAPTVDSAVAGSGTLSRAQ